MAAAVCTAGATSRSSACSSRHSYPICAHLALCAGDAGSKGVPRDVFIDMNRLSMLSEVVQAGESARAMALEGPFACMFSAERRQPLAGMFPNNIVWLKLNCIRTGYVEPDARFS